MKSFETLTSAFGSERQDLIAILNEKGYRSIFDIVRHSCTQFIRDMQGAAVKEKTATTIYHTALGLATQLHRQFVEVRASHSLTGLIKDGPTWQNLFQEDWSSYCLDNAPESNDSPVAYLAWLYRQALDFEAQMNSETVLKLAERRPDLPQLWIDDAAVNQVIPSLQLVNEILESAVTPFVKELGEASVDQVLASTRYPGMLPYHYPHQQSLLSLSDSNLSLEEVIKNADSAWPYFAQPDLKTGHAEMAWQLGSNLAPEQQTIITEADNSNLADMTPFYESNLGIATADYAPFSDPLTFCRASGIIAPQMEALLATNKGGTTVVVSENYLPGTPTTPTSADYGARFINSDGAEPIFLTPQDVWQNFETDTKSSPVPLVINSKNINGIAGKFNTGLTVNAIQGDEVYLPYDMSSDGINSKDFTLAFWCYIHPGIQDMCFVTTNKVKDIFDFSPGITLFLPGVGVHYFYLNAGDGTKVQEADAKYEVPLEKWVFVAIKLDSVNKKLYGQYCVDGENILTSTVDVSQLDSIAFKDGCWGFNGNKNNQYYKDFPYLAGAMSFDDITVWDRMLDDSEIKGFISSGKPGGGYSSMIHYYPLDGEIIYPAGMITNLSDARMDKINRMVRMQRWLDLPYDRVDSLVTSVADGIMLYNNPSVYLDGSYGNAVTLNSDEHQYIAINDHFSSNGKENKNFTMGFWVKVAEAPTGDVMICGNAEISKSGQSHDQGFFLLGSNKEFFFSMCDSNGSFISSRIGYEYNEWNYYIFSVDWDAGKVNVGKRTRGSDQPITNDEKVISTLITVQPDVSKWYFNNDSTEAYYPNFSRHAVIDIDGIAIWNTALSVDEMNAIASSTEPAGGREDMYWFYDVASAGLATTSHTLRMLNTLHHYQKTWHTSADEFAAVLSTLTPYAISPEVPFFDRVFNNPSLFEQPFAITDKDFSYTALTGADSRIVRQICAGLGITQAQFLRLAAWVAGQQGDATRALLSCSLNVVSAFYRLVMVPRWLGLAFDDGCALLKLLEDKGAIQQLAGVPFYSERDDAGQPMQADMLDTLMALSDLAEWLAAHELSASLLLAQTAVLDASLTLPATTRELTLVQGINQQLPATLLNEAAFSSAGIPEPVMSSGATFTSWMTALSDLVDSTGLVNADGKSYSDITAAVMTDVSGMTFSGMSQDQVADTLTTLIWQARQTQYGIADSAVANACQVALPLATLLLRWSGTQEHAFLSATLALAGITTPDAIDQDYLAQLYRIARRASLCLTYQLTPAALETLLTTPAWFGVMDTTITLPLCYLLSRYGDWLHIAGREDAALAYLAWVNQQKPDAGQAAQALALLLDWESGEVQQAAMQANPGDGIAQNLSHIDTVLRLKTLCSKAGVAVETIIGAAALSTTSDYAQWQAIGEALIASQH